MHLGRTGDPLSAAAAEALRLKLALYEGAVAHVDAAVDAVRARLLRWGLADTTVVGLYSDHGEEFLDHVADGRRRGHDPRGLYGIGHGHTLFQELLHVPWLAAGDGLPAGVRHLAPVSLCDVAPTFLDWLGLDPLPEVPCAMAALRGRSLAADLSGDAGDPGRLILSEEIAFGPDLVALRRDGWKLTAARAGEPLALHDLRGDPGETRDRLADEPVRAAALLEELAAWNRARPRDDRDGTQGWRDLSGTVRDRLRDLGYAD